MSGDRGKSGVNRSINERHGLVHLQVSTIALLGLVCDYDATSKMAFSLLNCGNLGPTSTFAQENERHN